MRGAFSFELRCHKYVLDTRFMEVKGKYDTVVPAPPHPQRLRRHGFKETVAARAALVKTIGCRFEMGFRRRTKSTQRRIESEHAQRQGGIGPAFEAKSANPIVGLGVLAVHDPARVGAPAHQCPRARSEAAAREFDAFARARAQRLTQ